VAPAAGVDCVTVGGEGVELAGRASIAAISGSSTVP
jgi:hypothetical protein